MQPPHRRRAASARLFAIYAVLAPLAGCGTDEAATSAFAEGFANDDSAAAGTSDDATAGGSNGGNDGSRDGADGPEPSSRDDAGAGALADAGDVGPASVRCEPTDVGALTAESLSSAGSFGFASRNLTLVDTTRVTPAHGSSPETASRVLPITVWYPAGNALFGDRPVAEGGPFPLVVYAHGFNLDKSAGQYLGEHLASHGFVVVGVDFPRSKQNADGGPTFDDLVHQPGDVSYVIDDLLSATGTAGVQLASAIDATRIAVVGYSLGGSTAMLAGYHSTLRDERISAVVSLAGIHAMFTKRFFASRALPALVLHGDLDAIIPYAPNARTALEAGAPNVQLVSIAKGTHVGFATLPLEPVVVGVAGPLVAPQGSDPNNADGLGCGTVGDLVPRDNAYLAPLGGEVAGITDPAPLDPCKLDELGQPALAPADQRTPTKQAVLAFLRAYLAVDASTRGAHCAFLDGTLGTTSGVTVE